MSRSGPNSNVIKRRKFRWPKDCKVWAAPGLPEGCQLLAVICKGGQPSAGKIFQAMLPQGCTFNGAWTFTKPGTMEHPLSPINAAAAVACLDWLSAAEASGCWDPVAPGASGSCTKPLVPHWQARGACVNPPAPIWRMSLGKKTKVARPCATAGSAFWAH